MTAKRIFAMAIYYPPQILAIIVLSAIMLAGAPIFLPFIGLEKLWDWARAELR